MFPNPTINTRVLDIQLDFLMTQVASWSESNLLMIDVNKLTLYYDLTCKTQWCISSYWKDPPAPNCHGRNILIESRTFKQLVDKNVNCRPVFFLLQEFFKFILFVLVSQPAVSLLSALHPPSDPIPARTKLPVRGQVELWRWAAEMGTEKHH